MKVQGSVAQPTCQMAKNFVKLITWRNDQPSSVILSVVHSMAQKFSI